MSRCPYLNDYGHVEHRCPHCSIEHASERGAYSVERLEQHQNAFEDARRTFHANGDHEGQAACEFALEQIRLIQSAAPQAMFTEAHAARTPPPPACDGGKAMLEFLKPSEAVAAALDAAAEFRTPAFAGLHDKSMQALEAEITEWLDEGFSVKVLNMAPADGHNSGKNYWRCPHCGMADYDGHEQSCVIRAMAERLRSTAQSATRAGSPDQLIKIDDGQSTHARTAKEWLDLARRDLAGRARSDSTSSRK